MRLGVLASEAASDTVTPDEQAVLALLRDRDIDVVLGHDEDAQSGVDQVKRLARADVDGALILPSWRGAVVVALHLADTPLLLCEGDNGDDGTIYDVLTQLNAPLDRLLVPVSRPEEAAGAIEQWLTENRRTERQRGHEAALKLYGQTMGVRGDALLGDGARYLLQFGLTVVPLSASDAAVGESPTVDFGSDQGLVGGIHALLTRHLLNLVSPSDAADATTIALSALSFSEETGEAAATFAALSRVGERFRCVLSRGFAGETGAPPRLPSHLQSHIGTTLSGGFDLRYLSYIAGEHVGAMRAACRALDIEAVVLRQ